MTELLFAFGTGLVAGFAHVYMGADHLAALMPLSVGKKLKAVWMGVRWGLGHSIGVIIVAVIFLAIRKAVDLEPVSEWGERIVGVMLIGLGVVGIRAAIKNKLHLHQHEHDGDQHAHMHVHVSDAHESAEAATGVSGKRAPGHSHVHTHAALAAGTLHGVAGMAHLLGVLPSLAFPTLRESFIYLLAFAIGTVAGMSAFAGIFGSITAKLGDKSPKLVKASMWFAAVVCILVGVAWIVVPLMGYDLP